MFGYEERVITKTEMLEIFKERISDLKKFDYYETSKIRSSKERARIEMSKSTLKLNRMLLGLHEPEHELLNLLN